MEFGCNVISTDFCGAHSKVKRDMTEIPGSIESQPLSTVSGAAGSPEQLADVVDALEDGVALWDTEMNFVLCNDKYCQLTQAGPHSKPHVGQSIHEILERDNHLYEMPVGMSAETYAKYTLDFVTSGKKDTKLYRKDGRRVLLSSSKTKLGGYLITAKEISDDRRAELADQEMENAVLRFNEALEAFDQGLVLWDSDMRLVLENERMFKMLYPGEEPPRIAQPGDAFTLVLTEQFANGVYKLPPGVPVDQIIQLWIGMIKALTKNMDIELGDGRILSGSSHDTSHGGYLLTFRDVTEQRRAEKSEREANMLLKVIVEACPTTFLVSRLDDGEIIYFPPESRAEFGDVNSTLEFFANPADRTTYLNALLPAGVLDDYPVKFRRRDGSVMDARTSARIAKYNGDDVIVSSSRDISDQLAMEAQLERQREISHQNEKLSALGELLAGVAHELNNPLSIVVGYALMLQGKVDDPVIDKRIQRIGQAAERCAKIVKMFLAMARQRPAEIENCSVNEIIEATLDVAGHSFISSGGRIKLELADDLPAVAADPDQLAQVITNLVVNAEQALKESGRKGVIKLITLLEPRSGKVVIKIRDNGRGIPKNIQSRVFEPFFTTKEVGAGTGVGLAFCHRTISAHNGTLTLYSEGGSGTTFIIRLCPSEQEADLAQVSSDQPIVSQNKKILVLDDEVSVTELICDILEDDGFDVTVENHPEAALTLLEKTRFDVLLSDMKMPGFNGEEFFSRVIDKHPDMQDKIAFITGDILSSQAADFFQSSKAAYLEKPISPSELVSLVHRLCGPDPSQGS